MVEHVVCGSIAIDRILLLDTPFDQHLLPEHLSRLSVSFLVPSIHESWGGTGANIAYALAQMGERPHLIGAIGRGDEVRLKARWDAMGIAHEHVVVSEEHTAQATILTDTEHNQITGFHPGAMSLSIETDVLAAHGADHRWTIVAPDGPLTMARHAQRLATAGRPYLFDPGQSMPLLSRETLMNAGDLASAILVNDYEMSLLTRATGWAAQDWADRLASRGGALIITRGKRGCEVWKADGMTAVPVAHAEAVIDPTGCGDAFRGGLMYGLGRGWDWVKAAHMGSALAAVQVAHEGTQNYHLPEGWAQQTAAGLLF
jgi:adenosine kinase